MKGLIFKSLVVVFLALGASNYLIYLKTGQLPLRDMQQRLNGALTDLRARLSPTNLAADAKAAVGRLSDADVGADSDASVKVYRWTDADGQVHFGDKPVAADAEPVNVELRNAISAPETSVFSRQATPAPAADAGGDTVLNKARAAADAMQERNQALENSY